MELNRIHARVTKTPVRFAPRNHTIPNADVLSSSLDCLLQCELYRLLEHQRAAFLPGAIESSVIFRCRARRGHAPVVPGQFIRRKWRSDLFLQSLRRAPDAGGAQRAAE